MRKVSTLLFIVIYVNTNALTWIHGSYTGDGAASHTITGLGFQPEVVIIKGSAATPAFIRTAAQVAGESKQLNIATNTLVTKAITAFTASGFTVGSNANVNTNGATYYFEAFDAGADLVQNSYTGNGGVTQAIAGLGFQPELVIVFSRNSALNAAGFLCSSMPANNTCRFGVAGLWGFYISSLDANGFTANSFYNTNLETLYYAAFNSSSATELVTGSYAGSASNKTVTVTGMTNPGLVWVCNSNASGLAVERTGTMPANSSATFDATAVSTNDILSLASGNFVTKAGSVHANNTSNTNYFTAFGAGGALPIELMDFSVECRNGEAEIRWITATETNNDYFTVERSKDGLAFQAVGNVSGAGNSIEPQFYSLTDDSVFSSFVYYRLKQTDYDGKYKYFNLVSYENCRLISGLEINLYPNPFDHEISYQFELKTDACLTVEVTDFLGNIIFIKYLKANKGNHLLMLDLSGISKGIYIFKMSDGINQVSRKIAKQ